MARSVLHVTCVSLIIVLLSISVVNAKLEQENLQPIAAGNGNVKDGFTKVVLHIKQAPPAQFPVRPLLAQVPVAQAIAQAKQTISGSVPAPPPSPPSTLQKSGLTEPYAGGNVVNAASLCSTPNCNAPVPVADVKTIYAGTAQTQQSLDAAAARTAAAGMAAAYAAANTPGAFGISPAVAQQIVQACASPPCDTIQARRLDSTMGFAAGNSLNTIPSSPLSSQGQALQSNSLPAGITGVVPQALQQLPQQIDQPNANGCGGVVPCLPIVRTVDGAPLQKSFERDPSRPVPMQMDVEALDMRKGGVTPQVNFGDREVGYFAVESLPSVRIIGQDACGCPDNGEPCNDPCQDKGQTAEQQVEHNLETIKNEIVQTSMSIREQTEWAKQVKDVIRHYEQKIRDVESGKGGLKARIKQLFAMKKHYEDLLLQRELDPVKFDQVWESQKGKDEKFWRKEKRDGEWVTAAST